ncbi:MAG: glycosyltransferase family 2 protein [Marinilabiliaceae bacterium]|nr:glycosyltransferase family 2 protein [Marinilabiliaceae bacterium]
MIEKVDFITIIVCTYNRADILKECLEALFSQTAPQSQYEVLVVDNNSADHTKQIVETFQAKHQNLRYYFEGEQGLSHARNAGYLNTKAKWVGYMDDDGLAHYDYIEKALAVIHNYNFDCFGGRYYAWFKYSKPRWMDAKFGQSEVKTFKTQILKDTYNDGGIIFIKTEVLKSIDGFHNLLGMNGYTIAYGEETLMQKRLRENNYTIGYSPQIKMNHLVAKHKLKLNWHLKSSYAHGRDSIIIWNKKDKFKFHFLIQKTIILFMQGTVNLLKAFLCKGYFWENAILDIFSPIYFLWGQYNGLKK